MASQGKSSEVHLHGYLSAVPHTRTHKICSPDTVVCARYGLTPPFQLSHQQFPPPCTQVWVLSGDTFPARAPYSICPYLPPVYPCCRMYAMRLLMFDSFFAPPFCAQFALSSAASLPSWSECPFVGTIRVLVPPILGTTLTGFGAKKRFVVVGIKRHRSDEQI